MKTQTIRLISGGTAVAGTILAVGSTLTGLPFLPGWVVQSWPILYGLAIAFDRFAHAFWPEIVPDADQSKIPETTMKTSPVAGKTSGDTMLDTMLMIFGCGVIFLLAMLLMPGCTMIPTQHGTAQFWGDYENVYFHDGAVTFTATTMTHSTIVRAHYHGLVLLGGEAVSSAIPGVGVGTKAAAAMVPSIVSGFTQPAKPVATPVTK